MSKSTIRLLVCSARPGVNKAQVLEATRATNGVLRRMPGFVEHEIACAVFDSEWIDIVHWSDPAFAADAETAFRRHPAAPAIAEVMEQQWITPMYLEEPAIDRCMLRAS